MKRLLNRILAAGIVGAMLVVSAASCAVLTKSQIKAVNNLSTKSDTITTAPEMIFETLADVREERGLYYAASLRSSDARYAEMNGLAEGSIADAKIVEKSTLYADVLDSYLRALRSLSADARYFGLRDAPARARKARPIRCFWH
jgi:DNA helicase TIP49 (TBP-interacting protein)